jgi:hypothetical protein
MENQLERELSYGEKAVGITFNPGNSDEVYKAKSLCAELINQMNGLRLASTSGEQKRLASVAITELQAAQMWCVKAITWKD